MDSEVVERNGKLFILDDWTTKALEDIRAACISSPYWHNQISHAPAHLQNVTRALLRHHKIATDAQKKIEKMNRAILET